MPADCNMPEALYIAIEMLARYIAVISIVNPSRTSLQRLIAL
jgi:hypothetical protein